MTIFTYAASPKNRAAGFWIRRQPKHLGVLNCGMSAFTYFVVAGVPIFIHVQLFNKHEAPYAMSRPIK